MSTRTLRASLTALLAVAALTLAACGNSNSALKSGGSGGGGPLIVGGANFSESNILAEIYAGALNGAGIDATTKPNIGSRETYLPALKDGSIDIFPEYTGVLRDYYAAKSGTTVSATDPAGVYKELQQVLPSYVRALQYSAAEDKDSVTVSQATANKYSLKSIGDLAPVAGKLTLGGPPEWKTRETGLPGLKKVYGVTFGKFTVTDAGGPLTLNALLDGRIDAGNLFTTNPQIPAKHLVALEDPKHLFAAQNVVPLVRNDAYSSKLQETLDKVSKALTTEDLVNLVKQVDVDKKDYKDVADSWLSSKGLS
jgi:osmoprotectant transport system substrate-binding protein